MDLETAVYSVSHQPLGEGGSFLATFGGNDREMAKAVTDSTISVASRLCGGKVSRAD